jgi:hypothetical protein
MKFVVRKYGRKLFRRSRLRWDYNIKMGLYLVKGVGFISGSQNEYYEH